VWTARAYKNNNNEDALELKYISPDKEEGYPGTLTATVIYTLTNSNELKIEYLASTDKPTVVNLTHHSFFNLHGFNSGNSKSINSHILQLNAPFYTPTDGGLIPTGVIAPVANTPMDFTKPKSIGERVNDNFQDLVNGKGYDHNWILDKNGDKISEAGNFFEPESGIAMSVLTDQPAVQFYGGNFFNGTATGKYGEVYTHRSSFALEAQHYPDSPNHSNFPSTVLKPGEKYSHVCIYKFSVR
jgi:aldose 1-epimerase